MKALITCSIVLMLGACSSVTIQPQKIAKLSDKPTYQDSRPFYLWGLVGEERVDVKEICTDTQAAQMQSQQTFSDGALGLITLGIYSPHTIKVWCEEQNTQEAL